MPPAELVSPRKARRLPAEAPSRPRRGSGGSGGKGTGKGAAAEADSAPRLGPPQTELWPDGEWIVRHVPGAAATKTYRCPGCDQELVPGNAHVVVWPAYTPGAAERRHWHSSCWQRRPRRTSR
jgi:hypothetical protein